MKRKLLLILLALPWPAWAQDDDLQEAQGLPDEKPLETAKSSWHWPEGFTERSYIWVEGLVKRPPSAEWQEAEGPNAEASLTLNYKSSAAWQAFLDGRVLHNADPKFDRGILEQGGLRYQATEKILLAIGKERSRKAPGLIIAPSDFLYAQENLPGQREQRAGLWQGRIAWQETGRSLEVLALPYDQLNDNGLPDDEARWNGWAARGYYQFANFDLQLAAGHLRDGDHEGLSTQGIIGPWKLYAEAGWREHAKSQLGGLEYQGWDKWSARVEYFHQEETLLLRFSPFPREHYAITSVSAVGLDDRWNLFATLVRSLDDRSYLGNLRGEWLIDDHQVLGLSGLALSRGEQRQVSLDWKFTF